MKIHNSHCLQMNRILILKWLILFALGFSLGGQIAGQSGYKLSEKIPRITALDPARPLFDVSIDFLWDKRM